MSFPAEPDMMSKELQNSDSIYVNLMTDVFKIIVKYRQKIIAKYRHLSPSGDRALQYLLKCTLHVSSWRLKCYYNERNSVGTDRENVSRSLIMI